MSVVVGVSTFIYTIPSNPPPLPHIPTLPFNIKNHTYSFISSSGYFLFIFRNFVSCSGLVSCSSLFLVISNPPPLMKTHLIKHWNALFFLYLWSVFWWIHFPVFTTSHHQSFDISLNHFFMFMMSLLRTSEMSKMIATWRPSVSDLVFLHSNTCR